MPCTPDNCDIHDFMVAPNSAWCRMEYAKRSGEGSRLASEMGLADAIFRMGDLVEELLTERKSRFKPTRQQTEAKPPARRGGTPL